MTAVTRPPAVAGLFYPAAASALRKELKGYLAGGDGPEDAVAVVSPHAGTIYSGPTAGRVFSSVRVPPTVVVVGVNHRHTDAPPLAIYPAGAWRTPLGDVPIDEAFAAAWRRRFPGLDPDARHHADEHSLEVQVPFLQTVRPDVSIVPLMVSTHDRAFLAGAGKALAETVADRDPHPLLVASTDMTHFQSEDRARADDQAAIERIAALDPDGLLDVVARRRISMCGAAPTALVLYAAIALGARAVELVDYRTSAAVTGDTSEVVGYAGLVIR